MRRREFIKLFVGVVATPLLSLAARNPPGYVAP